MFKQKFPIYSFLIAIFLSGCSGKIPNILIYELKRGEFSEKIFAPGTIQAVNTISVVAPRVPVMTMTVAHLVPDGAIVKKGDTVAIVAAPEIVSRLETYEDDLEKLQADAKKLEADNAMNLSLLETQIDNNNAQVELKSLDSVQQKFAPPLNQRLYKLELEKAMVEKNKLKKKFESLKKISDSDLRKMKSRIMQSENMIQMVKLQINSLTLVAPSDGMVMHVVAPTMMFMSMSGMGVLGGKIEEGSSVWSNGMVLQIPDLNKVQVAVEVPEGDYKRIEKGQKVRIQVDAASELKTTGSVLKKSPVGRQSQNESTVKSYEVIVSVDSCHLLMTPGLSAKCNIIVNEVLDTLVLPTIAIFKQDSTKIVYVSEGDKFVPVTVETGLSNSSETIVSKGLTGTESVALTEPPFNLIKKVNK